MSTPLGASNPAVQRLRRLARRRSSRSEEGAYLVDGPVLLSEAVDAGVDLEVVFVEPAARDQAVVRAVADRGFAVREVDDGVLARVLDVVTPQHVVAVVRRRPVALDDVLAAGPADAPLLVLVEVQDPGNAGTLVRVAEAAGCRGVVLTRGSVDVTNPKTVRAAAGSSFRLPVADGLDTGDVLAACERAGLATWATVRDGELSYDVVDLVGPVAFVVGSEARGLSADVVDRCRGRLTIPMAGRVDSLNAGVAGAVVLFEAARQRRVRSEWPTPGGAGPQ